MVWVELAAGGRRPGAEKTGVSQVTVSEKSGDHIGSVFKMKG